MQILGGFITALGVAAVAVSLSIFSLGMMPLTTAVIVSGTGLVTSLAGIGLFKFESTPKKSEIENEIMSKNASTATPEVL